MINDWWNWAPQLLAGLVVSVQIASLALVVGLPIGLGLAVLSTHGPRWTRMLCIGIVETLRGLPALVIVYVIYFGLPPAGLTLSAFLTMVTALALSTAGYSSEIFRAGIQSVPLGLQEAASALGLGSVARFRYVILPRALVVSVPPLVSIGIIVFQATALGFAIGMHELLGSAYQIGSNTFQYLSVLTLAGLMYAAICIPTSRMFNKWGAREGGQSNSARSSSKELSTSTSVT